MKNASQLNVFFSVICNRFLYRCHHRKGYQGEMTWHGFLATSHDP